MTWIYLQFLREQSTYTDTNNPFNRVWIVHQVNIWTLIWLISQRLHWQTELALLIWTTRRCTEDLHWWLFTQGLSTDTYDRSHYCSENWDSNIPGGIDFDFQVSKKKRVDRNLIFFVIPSPPCFATFAAMYKGEAQNSRALLCLMYGAV